MNNAITPACRRYHVFLHLVCMTFDSYLWSCIELDMHNHIIFGPLLFSEIRIKPRLKKIESPLPSRRRLSHYNSLYLSLHSSPFFKKRLLCLRRSSSHLRAKNERTNLLVYSYRASPSFCRPRKKNSGYLRRLSSYTLHSGLKS